MFCNCQAGIYGKICKHKIGLLAGDTSMLFDQEEISKLPYIFKDPIKFDKKIDPRKLKFGSKIDNSNTERVSYYTVEDVISPEILVLNNKLKIRLLGIKEIPKKTSEAINFIREKTSGQRVFLNYDNIKYDENNNLLCYLYLWNKTFINAHLIKNGLADVDTSTDYKYKVRFLSYKGED